jgi:hypothetical protein
MNTYLNLYLADLFLEIFQAKSCGENQKNNFFPKPYLL